MATKTQVNTDSAQTLTNKTLTAPIFNGTFADLQSGQLKFPSTQIPSADPNTLDDYEEGTWTPSVGGTATYTVQTGNYIKIGRLVQCFFLLTINVLGTGSNNTISGLPFPAVLDGPSGCLDVSNAAITFVYAFAKTNGSSLGMKGLTVAGGTTGFINIIGNSTSITGYIIYLS